MWDDQTWEDMAEALAMPDSVRSAFDLAMFEPGAVVRDGGEWLLCGVSQPASIHEPWVEAILQRFGFVLWYKSAYDEQKMRPILERNLPVALM